MNNRIAALKSQLNQVRNLDVPPDFCNNVEWLIGQFIEQKTREEQYKAIERKAFRERQDYLAYEEDDR